MSACQRAPHPACLHHGFVLLVAILASGQWSRVSRASYQCQKELLGRVPLAGPVLAELMPANQAGQPDASRNPACHRAGHSPSASFCLCLRKPETGKLVDPELAAATANKRHRHPEHCRQAPRGSLDPARCRRPALARKQMKARRRYQRRAKEGVVAVKRRWSGGSAFELRKLSAPGARRQAPTSNVGLRAQDQYTVPRTRRQLHSGTMAFDLNVPHGRSVASSIALFHPTSNLIFGCQPLIARIALALQ